MSQGFNAVTAVDPMQVDKTLTSEGELSVGEVDIYPGAKRAKGGEGRESAGLRILRSEADKIRALSAALQTELPKSHGKFQEWREASPSKVRIDTQIVVKSKTKRPGVLPEQDRMSHRTRKKEDGPTSILRHNHQNMTWFTKVEVFLLVCQTGAAPLTRSF